MRKVEKEYLYTNEENEVLYKAIRYKPKSFSQAKNVNGRWENNMDNVRYVPYNLPNITKAEEIYFVEGEKDADNLNNLGLVATTTIGGAQGFNKHKNEYCKYFINKNVYIIPDNDEAGYKYAEDIKEALRSTAKQVKILHLVDEVVDLNEKEDISDILSKLGKKTTLDIIEKLKVSFDFSNYSGQHINLRMLENILETLGITIKYNEITKEAEINGLPLEYSKESAEDILPALISDICINNHIKYKDKDIRNEILLLSDSNRYNPIREMLTMNQWDGIDRFPILFEIIGITDDKLSNILIRKWFQQTTMIVFNNKEKPYGIDGVLVFQGKQGCGKTRIIRNLAINPEWFKEGAVIDLNVKDSLIEASRGWIVELRRNRFYFEEKTISFKSISD